MSKEVIHDFRDKNLKWGWNGLDFKKLDETTAEMLGIGKGIKKGEYIALSHSGKDYGYEVLNINYRSNPADMFNATLKIKGYIED